MSEARHAEPAIDRLFDGVRRAVKPALPDYPIRPLDGNAARAPRRCRGAGESGHAVLREMGALVKPGLAGSVPKRGDDVRERQAEAIDSRR
jgi:hypothetical protein